MMRSSSFADAALLVMTAAPLYVMLACVTGRTFIISTQLNAAKQARPNKPRITDYFIFCVTTSLPAVGTARAVYAERIWVSVARLTAA